MSQIYFYHQVYDRTEAICQLVFRAWQKKKSWLILYIPDDQLAEEINRRLWILPKTSFVPHCYDTMPIAAETPILLSKELQNQHLISTHPRLINVSDALPPDYKRYLHIIEVVSADQEIAALGRQRVRQYREAGDTVSFHTLNS